MDIELSEFERRIIIAFADNDMRIAQVSRMFHYNDATITYHFERVHKRTGLNPRKFHDLVRLIQYIRAADSGVSS